MLIHIIEYRPAAKPETEQADESAFASLAGQLAALSGEFGFETARTAAAGREALGEAIGAAAERSVTLILGGLSPDEGFPSRQALSEALGLPLRTSKRALAHIGEVCRKQGLDPAPFAGYALLPRSSKALIGKGLIPGCVVSRGDRVFVLAGEEADGRVLEQLRSLFGLLAPPAEDAVPPRSEETQQAAKSLTAAAQAQPALGGQGPDYPESADGPSPQAPPNGAAPRDETEPAAANRFTEPENRPPPEKSDRSHVVL